VGRQRLGIWKKIARGDAGHKKAQKDLSTAVYLTGMASWLLTKLINHSEFARFQGRPTELDDMCFERVHKAMRLLFEARRDLEWVANASELEAQEHDPTDKVEFAGQEEEGDTEQAPSDDSIDDLVKLIDDPATTTTGG